MRTIPRIIDTISDCIAKTTRWLVLALVLLVSWEVFMRYAFNSPTMWNYETSMMVGGTIYIIGWAYAHRQHSHVRVDVLYSRLSSRGRAAIDLIGSLVIFFPLMIALVGTSATTTWRAWLINEKSVETSWYPPIAPFRTVVTLGLVLFAIQGIAQFIQDLNAVVGGTRHD